MARFDYVPNKHFDVGSTSADVSISAAVCRRRLDLGWTSA